MDRNIERELFEIPDSVEFPLELCHHLKSKLHGVMEQNWHLKRHVEYLDKEVIELRKLKADKTQASPPTRPVVENDSSCSLMATKIVELSKKNRDMTSQLESMKTKIKKLMNDNEKLRNRSEEQDADDRSQLETVTLAHTKEDSVSSSQQLSQVTSKLMEYRRQCQQLRIELKTALRALSQEVGDQVTPQTVLSTVDNASWRGRQQQIIALQQKLADLQIKVAIGSNCHSEAQQLQLRDDSGFQGEEDISVSEVSVASFRKVSISMMSDKSSIPCPSVSYSAAPSHRLGLMQQDAKKQDRLRKLSSDVDLMSSDLKARQEELKASKARNQTLENQAKSFRNQIDYLEAKLQEKELEFKTVWSEMNILKQALMSTKDRETRNRDKSDLETQEVNRALTREREIVKRLQQVINEKQEALQKADGEIIELRNRLELWCSSNVTGGLNAVERIEELEEQLNQYGKLLESSEKERHRLREMVDNAVNDTEKERHKVTKAQKAQAEVLLVLQQANQCIDKCLDVTNATNPNVLEVLQDVEKVRTLIREIKTGHLYSLSNESGISSTKRFKTKAELLSKEKKWKS